MVAKNSAVNKEQREKLKKLFETKDKDNSGDLAVSELKDVFNELGHNRSENEIEMIIKKASFDSKKSLNFHDFENLFSVSKLIDIFNEIDSDKSGNLDLNEIITCFKKLGYVITNEQCKDLLRKVDTDSNGEISFDEFRTVFETVPLASMETIASHWSSFVIPKDCGSDLSVSLPIPGLQLWQTILAGGCAGVLSRTLTAPLEKIKISAQTGTNFSGGGMISEILSVYRNQGVKGLFAGNLTNCIRVFPTAGIACTCYINLLALTPADNELDMMEPVYRLLCGGAAGLIANSITYPLDIIRARVTTSKTNLSIMGCFKELTAGSRGVSGLYTGIFPTLLAAVPFAAVQNATIDIVKALAQERGWDATPLVLVSAGACAGMLAQTVVYPLDVFRRRMQVAHTEVQTTANKNVIADQTWLAMKSAVKQHGFRSLFAGIVPTFTKTIPAVAIFSYVANTINGRFREINGKK